MSYDTVQYADQMLTGSAVLIDGDPCGVNEVIDGPPMSVRARSFRTGKSVTVPIDKCDYRSMSSRLGYMNIEFKGYRSTLFISRIPVRHATNGAQGLSSRNVRVVGPMWSKPGGAREAREAGIGTDDPNSFLRVVSMPAFVDMLDNKYPTLVEAAESMEDPNTHSVAFARDYRLCREDWAPFFVVERRGKKVGALHNGSIELVSCMFWVGDELSDLGIKVA